MNLKFNVLLIFFILSSCENIIICNSSNTSIESEKTNYRDLVDRDRIVYSTPLENDLNHDISKLEVFQINDTHGAFYDEESTIGIARVSTCIKENSEDIYGVVKIANGDILQGSAFSNMLQGEPAIASLNEMNFDAFVIGNHEFDWYLDTLKEYKDNDLSNGELNCDFLGANIVDKNGNLPDFIKPYTIVYKGDVKVGIIGVVGDGLESSISSLSLNGYSFSSTSEAVKKYSDELLNEHNVDVIIVSTHAHNDVINQKYVDESKVDLIINAHDHYRFTSQVNRYDGVKVPVIESNTKNITIGKVSLNLNENNQFVSYEANHYYPNDYSLDNNLKNIIDVYYEVTSAYENEVIGYTSSDLSKSEIATSTCNYIASKYNADLVFVNKGGVRDSISIGKITNGNIYEVFPFDNELYISSLNGSQIKKMISDEYVDTYYYNTSGIGTGDSYDYNIKDDKIYKVITVDYLANKDYMEEYFSTSLNSVIQTGDYIRDCAIENIKQNFKK